jgi:glucose-6-phosphate-specific signal transduction histidine kinase
MSYDLTTGHFSRSSAFSLNFGKVFHISDAKILNCPRRRYFTLHNGLKNLLMTYRVGNDGINLVTDIDEDIFFDIDTAVPLGIIINELVSNSLKHAFPEKDKGEIQINLYTEEVRENNTERSKSKTFTLTISDNGIGIPEDIDIVDLDSLGIQLIITLIEQLDGELKLKRNKGTMFIIKFTVTEKLKEENVPDVEESVTANKSTQLTLHRFCLPE